MLQFSSWRKSKKRATEAATHREQVEADTEIRLQQLEAEYLQRLQNAAAGLPKLLEDANVAAAAVTEQQVIMGETEAACRQQAEAVEQCLKAEMNAPQELAAAVEKLKAEKQVALNQAQTQLLSLEEKQQSLQVAYKESCDYAEKAEAAKKEVETYLNDRLQVQEQEKSECARRIREMETRLATLKEDATAKERAYREAEKMLEDSSSLLQNASSAI